MMRTTLQQVRRWFQAPNDATVPQRPSNGRFEVQGAEALLAPHNGLISTLKGLAGVPESHWQRLYQALLDRFAALVQLLPASEAHHHAGPGGLLRHGLEVAHNSLLLRRGILLPPNASPEDQASQQDLWTYACFTGALLHDLGKPVVDQAITFYQTNGSDRAWTPVSGPMPEGCQYQMTFRHGRVHRQHERIAPLLAPILLPQHGLDWLASAPTLLDAWLAAIQGAMEDAGPLGAIIAKADRRSVAENLAGGVTPQMPTTRVKPLAERLLTGLRHLLTSGELPLNRRGAAGFTDEHHIWLVSKRAIDALLVHLIEEGQPGIPTRNSRVMDELQQHGIVIPNEDRAIWLCDITIGDWRQSLTCLKIDLSRIWPDPDQRPSGIGVTVHPSATKPVTEADSGEEGGTDQDSRPLAQDSEIHPAPDSELDLPSPPTSMPTGHAEARNSETIADDLALPLPMYLNAGGNADEETTQDTDKQIEADTSTPTAQPTTSAPPPLKKTEEEQVSGDVGKQFLAWLRDGLATGRLAINTPQARIHVIEQGLVLVSPGIFKDFSAARWNHVQKRFQKLKLHQRTHDNMNIWTCKASGARKQALMKVYLISKTEVSELGLTLPPPNPAVNLLPMA
ncbi:MobH family relaxase [Alloalcanivorax xenomutans]|uniref:MobH family relaxase n=1 Tax=Alloalcanivorax xenomutans TaxID=1094342 RepID=UPI0029313228|nr:MobH family relaxase [Alloalcanivorax xenomutans]WOA33391.1 MobH family relaxase [Alloalcanivorax xenomutans]